jgi:hypothetical protein
MAKSIITKCARSDFIRIIKASHCLKDVLNSLGVAVNSGNYFTLKNKFRSENLEDSFLKLKNSKNNFGNFSKKVLLSEILVENSSYSRGSLKRKIINEGLIKNECAECGLSPVWNKKPLVMVLDHKNGIPNDNRLENLRLVCPNCNSQLPTFAGRKHKKIRRCLICNGITGKTETGLCTLCSHKKLGFQSKKVNWPTNNKLENQIHKFGYEKTGRLYGVTGAAVKKRLKRKPYTKEELEIINF